MLVAVCLARSCVLHMTHYYYRVRTYLFTYLFAVHGGGVFLTGVESDVEEGRAVDEAR